MFYSLVFFFCILSVRLFLIKRVLVLNVTVSIKILYEIIENKKRKQTMENLIESESRINLNYEHTGTVTSTSYDMITLFFITHASRLAI